MESLTPDTLPRFFARGLGIAVTESTGDAAILAQLGKSPQILPHLKRFQESKPLKLQPRTVADWVLMTLRAAGEIKCPAEDLDDLIKSVMVVAFQAAALTPPTPPALQRITRDVRGLIKARFVVVARPAGSVLLPVVSDPEPADPIPSTVAPDEEAGQETVALIERLQDRCYWHACAPLRLEILGRMKRLLGLLDSSQHQADDRLLFGFREHLESLTTAVTGVLLELPTEAERSVLDYEVEDVALSWQGVDYDDPVIVEQIERLAAMGSPWQAVHEAAVRAERLSRACLPGWLWPKGIGLAAPVERTLNLLEDRVLLVDLEQCVQWVDQNVPRDDQDAVVDLQPPRLDAPPLDRLKEAWEAFVGRRETSRVLQERLDALPNCIPMAARALLHARLEASESLSELDCIVALAGRLSALSATLHPDFVQGCLDLLVADGPAAEAALTAAEAVAQDMGVVVLAAMTRVDAVLVLARRVSLPPPAPVLPQHHEVRFDHVMSKQFGMTTTTHAASLTWIPLEGNSHFGLLRVPVRVKVTPPLAEPRRIAVRLQGHWWDDVRTSKVVASQVTDSVELKAGEVTDVELVIPTTRRFAGDVRDRKRKLEVSIDASSDELSGRPMTLSWEKVRDALPRFQEPFVQSAGLEEVRRFALGVERHLDDVADLLSSGSSSFVVFGYRRFGKSTLIRSLPQVVDQNTTFVLKPVTATGRTPRQVWELIGQQLVEKFDRPVALELTDLHLPAAGAFDKVRQEAAAKGIRAIYVLIDEAQALFAHPDGMAMGERLKERLESEWGVRTAGKVPLLVGLVGQMSLRRVVGANLFAALTTFQTEPIGEDELVALLRAMADGGIESSADARQYLVTLAGNLYVLKHCLQALVRHCREQGKSWFVREDVELVFQRLVSDASDSAGTLWRYVRDPLNESENLEDWRPGETYAVALAWARVIGDGLNFRRERERFLERLRDVLGAWGSLTVSEPRLHQVVQELMDDRVLTEQGEFYFPLLGRLFEERARQPPQWDDAERSALERLGLRRIRCLPNPGANSLEGGQARVYPGRAPLPLRDLAELHRGA